VDAGGGLLVADSALTPEWVSSTVPDLLTDRSRLAAMSAAATLVIPLDADDKLAEMILTARSGSGSHKGSRKRTGKRDRHRDQESDQQGSGP
jgi:hypothetical protein